MRKVYTPGGLVLVACWPNSPSGSSNKALKLLIDLLNAGDYERASANGFHGHGVCTSERLAGKELGLCRFSTCNTATALLARGAKKDMLPKALPSQRVYDQLIGSSEQYMIWHL